MAATKRRQSAHEATASAILVKPVPVNGARAYLQSFCLLLQGFKGGLVGLRMRRQLLPKVRHLLLSVGQAGLQAFHLLSQGRHSARQIILLLLQLCMICLQELAENLRHLRRPLAKRYNSMLQLMRSSLVTAVIERNKCSIDRRT